MAWETDEEAYERGQQDAENSSGIDQTCHNLGHSLPGTGSSTEEAYDKGWHDWFDN